MILIRIIFALLVLLVLARYRSGALSGRQVTAFFAIAAVLYLAWFIGGYYASYKGGPWEKIDQMSEAPIWQYLKEEHIKWGYIDRTGKIVIKPGVDAPWHFHGGVAQVRIDGRWTLVNRAGERIVPQFTFFLGSTEITVPGFESMLAFSEGLAAVEYNRKWGYIDQAGSVVIPLTFKEASSFSEGLAAVKTGEERWGYERWGYIDRTGEFVILPRMDWHRAYPFQDCLAQIEVGKGHAGDAVIVESRYIDRSGQLVSLPAGSSLGCDVPREWPRASYRANGCEYIDKTGKSLKPEIDKMLSFSDGRPMKLGVGWGYVNLGRATRFIPRQSGETLDFGLFSIRRRGDGTWRYFVNQQFEWASDFSEGLAVVAIGGKSGYLDETGNYAIQPQFDFADSFSKGLAAVRIGDRAGFIDRTGAFVIPPRFEYTYSFSEGLATVKLGGKWGYIDMSGRLVIQPQFVGVDHFVEGMARVVVDPEQGYGYVDTKGTLVIPLQFKHAMAFSEGLAAVAIKDKRHGSLWGYLDPTGTFVIAPQFDTAESFADGRAYVVRGGGEPFRGYIDKSGRTLFSSAVPEEPPHSAPAATGLRREGWEFVDTTGAIIKPQIDKVLGFVNGHPVKVDDRWEYVDLGRSEYIILSSTWEESGMQFPQGHTPAGNAASKLIAYSTPGYDELDYAIAPDFAECREFSENGLAGVKSTSRWGVIDVRGDYVIPPRFAHLGEGPLFAEGLHPVGIADDGAYAPELYPIVKGWGYVNQQGAFVITPQFDWALAFSEGLAAVKVGGRWEKDERKRIRDYVGGRWGYIDKTGHFVVQPQFHDAGSFSDGLAPVKLEQ